MYPSPTPIVLSQFDVVLLGLMMEAKKKIQFCPHEEYHPGVCEAEGCRVCLDLMIQEGGHA